MTSRLHRIAPVAVLLLTLAAALGATACAGGRAATPTAAAPAAAEPADAFLAALAQHCGKAFLGRVVVDQPPSATDLFSGKTLVAHLRQCAPGEVRVPFHVGDDRSRTWVLSRTATGLHLAHDHRHADGSPDAVTMYGGATREPGTAQRQEFPVDVFSIALFEGAGLGASVTNTWAMEIEPGRRLLYELSRPGGRLFQVEFDLSEPVEAPPPPWGHEAAE
jgi:hypothetical protein